MYNFNVAPYFDDFDAEKNFHKILFKPGYAVQSRELTQIQSILQEQAKKFGDHVFKNGSMVIAGMPSADFSVKVVRVLLSDSTFNVDLLKNTTLVGANDGVRSLIIHATKSLGIAELYVKTIANGQTNPALDSIQDSEIVTYINDGGEQQLGTAIDSNAVTNGALGFVDNGIYYVNGYFINVYRQSVSISNSSSTPSGLVGLQVVEEITTEGDDTSLLDPAAGSSNENAPGAHRYKISLVLKYFADASDLPEDFIILFRIDSGEVIKMVDSSAYNELMKTIAKRTYEESGNYIVNPYEFQLKETSPISDAVDVFIRKGISYVGGYHVNNTFNRLHTQIQKSRASAAVNNNLSRVNFGNYILITDAVGLPATWSYIELRDQTVSTPGTAAGNIVGYAKVRSVERTMISNVYRVYIFDAEYAVNKNIRDVASIIQAPSSGNKTANVVVEIGISNISGTFNAVNEITAQNSTTNVVIPVSVTSNTILAKKKAGSFNFVDPGDIVLQATSNATGSVSRAIKLIEPIENTSLLYLPKAAVKSVSDASYTVTRQIPLALTGATSVHSPLGVGETLSSPSTAAVWNASTGAFLTVTFTEGGTSLTITGGTAGNNVIVSANVRKSAASQKTKTKATASISGFVTNGARKISLGKTNAIRIISITESGNDVTSRYRLVRNAATGSIGSSYIELKTGEVSPGTVNIEFEYLINSSGDYSSVLSYTSLAAGEDFIAEIPFADSDSSTRLGDVIDFRPITLDRVYAVTATTTSGNATITLGTNFTNKLVSSGLRIYGPGVNTTIASIPANATQLVLTVAPSSSMVDGIFLIGVDAQFSAIIAGTSEPIAANSNFIYDYEYYIPRRDLICLTNDGSLEVYPGTPSENPLTPNADENEFRMKLVELYVPPYTFNSMDIVISAYNRRRYTMADIGSLDRRISNVEEVTALNMLEQDLASTQIIDPVTGLNRFKTGFVVDNFRDHSVVDLEAESLAMIDYKTETLSPLKDGVGMPLVVVESQSTNYREQDNLILLPYTEEVLIDQPMATRPQNVNPFAVFKWFGEVKLTPASDFWIETRRLADINISRTINN